MVKFYPEKKKEIELGIVVFAVKKGVGPSKTGRIIVNDTIFKCIATGKYLIERHMIEMNI